MNHSSSTGENAKRTAFKKVDFGVSLGLIAISIYFFYLAGEIPTTEKFKDVSAGIWPRIILSLMILSCVILFVDSLKPAKGQISKPDQTDPGRFLLPISICLAYVLTMRWLGFLFGSAIFSLVYMYLLGFREKIKLLSFSLAVPFLIGLIFFRIMYVPIPKGVWIFKKVTETFLSF